MASEEDQPIYHDDDFDDEDDDSEPLNDGVPHDGVIVDFESSSDDDVHDSTVPLDSTIPGADSTAVTLAIPSSSSTSIAAVVPPPPSSSNAVTIALPDPKRHRVDPPAVTPEKKPQIDDSRRLFQRLWTDEDEIELLQGFLDYTSSRGTNSSGHHHDTAAFYDQIKSKLQLEFNKNQLVEKLRRLKKKYRNVLSKMSSGKDFVFKSPHDQATFELSRKIWSNLSTNYRSVAEFDDDDQQNPNPNSGNSLIVASATPPRPPNSSYLISHINLNNSAAATPVPTPMVVDYKGLIEETVRSCLSPMVKDLVNNAMNGTVLGGGIIGGGGIKGVGGLALNAVPFNLMGNSGGGGGGDVMDEKWRNQQILELEVYSKRLELVQDQIKLSLEELRSIGS